MTFKKNWRYIILNGATSKITPTLIQNGLNSYPVPSKWITLSNDQSIQWSVINNGSIGMYPWPQQEYTGAFFFNNPSNPSDPNNNIRDKYGKRVDPHAGAIGGYNRFSIAVEPNDFYSNQYSLGFTTFHEIVNGYGFPNNTYYADAVFRNATRSIKPQFCASAMNDYRWKNDKQVYSFCNTPSAPNYTYPGSWAEHATLSWCMEKMFPQNCLPDDYNPFNAVKPLPSLPTVNATVTCINNYTQNIPMPNVIVTKIYSGQSYTYFTNSSGVTSFTIPCGIPVNITTKTSSYPGTTKSWNINIGYCSGNYRWVLPVGN